MVCDPVLNTSWKPIYRLGGSQTYTLHMSGAGVPTLTQMWSQEQNSLKMARHKNPYSQNNL